jgi:hypothetical protein
MSTGERYPVRETGLVIVDPLNDFLSEGGKGWNAVKKDAVGATSWEAQRAAIEVNYPRYASAILTVDEFLESLSEKSES